MPYRDDSSRWLLGALVLAVVAISHAAIFFRLAQPTHPLIAAGVRLLFASLLLAPIWLSSATRRRAAKRQLVAAILAGICYALHFGSWVWSLELTSIAASVTLVTTTPLLLGAYGFIVGRDAPSRLLWLAIAISIAGVGVIGFGDWRATPRALVGDALALVGAVAIASYFQIGRRLGEELEIWSFGGVATFSGAALLLAGSTAASLGPWPDREGLVYLALSALIPQLIGHTLLTWSLRHTTPTIVGMATVGEPAGAALLGWIWIDEKPPIVTAIGCTITALAVLLALNAGSSRLSEPRHGGTLCERRNRELQ
ncbi:MAG: DMT family transporter [Myxococcales bacterium]|nr:DMT family transporter [Myxococcales bacterium]